MVSACAADPVKLPDFEEAARKDVEITYSTQLPMLCEIPYTDPQCYVRLDVYEDVAEGNTALADLNAGIIVDGEASYDHILSGAKKQQEVGQIRQEMLEQERRDHFWDNVWHRGLILAMAIGMIL